MNVMHQASEVATIGATRIGGATPIGANNVGGAVVQPWVVPEYHLDLRVWCDISL
jgi:hypothetical protein